jgi:hypothetical protein
LREAQDVQFVQGAARPPRHRANIRLRSAPGINPGAILAHAIGQDLIELRHFQSIRQIILLFGRAKKFFNHIARNDANDGRLHIFGRTGQHFRAPDNLRDGQWRELLKLKLKHGKQFSPIHLGQLNDPQENRMRRQPRNIQLRLNQLMPVFADKFCGERGNPGDRFLALQLHVIPFHSEVPEVALDRAGIENVAGMKALFLHA